MENRYLVCEDIQKVQEAAKLIKGFINKYEEVRAFTTKQDLALASGLHKIALDVVTHLASIPGVVPESAEDMKS